MRWFERLVNSYGSWVQKDCENTEGGTGRYTRELWPYDTMFSPIQVNRLTIKNRLVMAPMGNCQMAEETGRPTGQNARVLFWPAPKAALAFSPRASSPSATTSTRSVTEKGNFSYFPRIDNTRTNFMGLARSGAGVHAPQQPHFHPAHRRSRPCRQPAVPYDEVRAARVRLLESELLYSEHSLPSPYRP